MVKRKVIDNAVILEEKNRIKAIAMIKDFRFYEDMVGDEDELIDVQIVDLSGSEPVETLVSYKALREFFSGVQEAVERLKRARPLHREDS